MWELALLAVLGAVVLPSILGGPAGASGGLLSSRGLAWLKKEEGFRANRYWDFAGYSTGYGHLIEPGEYVPEPISEPQAAALLAADVQGEYAPAVLEKVGDLGLPQHKLDALLLLCYNIGTGGFKGSTVVKRIRNGAPSADVAEAWRRWNKAGGVYHAGLAARREREISVFINGSYPWGC